MTVSKLRLGVTAATMLFLSILPLGEGLGLFRPFWLLLFFIYLQCTLPKQCGVLFILLLGLILDALGAGVLGEHAFALLLTIFMLSKRARRFRLFSMSQQLFGIATFSCLYQLILLLIQIVLAYPVSVWGTVLPVVTTVLCWPWLQYLGDRLFFGSLSRTS